METRVETLAELKKIRFGQYGTIFCKETEREYYFEPNGGSLTPDDLDVVMAAQGGNARLVAHKAYSTGGGGGGGVSDASNVGPVSSKRVFRDKTGTILNFRRLTAGTGITLTENADDIVIASSGGGGAYPENITVHSGSGTLDLDSSHQGIIIVTGTGSVRLPASAADGTTYKIIPGAGTVQIDTNGLPIFGYGTGTFRLGLIPTILKKISSPANGWAVENKNTYPAWTSDTAFGIGDICSHSSQLYASMIDNNINNDPATSQNFWRKVFKRAFYQSTISEPGVTFY